MRDSSRLTAPLRLVHLARVTTDVLDVTEHSVLVSGPDSGAVLTFAGVIRDHDHGRSVTGIDYLAHPSAGDVLAQVAAEVSAAHPVDGVAVSHRIGSLAVGEVALAAAVSAAHRHEAFACLSELIDVIKRRLPVWKHQHLADGTDEWVGCP